MDAALDWHAVNSITLSVIGEGAALAEDAQYGFAALNFYTKRISLGDVTDANLDGTVDVVSNVGKNNISEYWVSATAEDARTFFHNWAMIGSEPIGEGGYNGEAKSNADVQNGASLADMKTNSAAALRSFEEKNGYQWNGSTLFVPVVSEYWKEGKDISSDLVALEIYLEKESQYGEIWILFSSLETAQHNWNLGAKEASNTIRAILIDTKTLDQGWNTVLLDINNPCGMTGTPMSGTNIYGYYANSGYDNGAKYTGPDGEAQGNGDWMAVRDNSGKLTNRYGHIFNYNSLNTSKVHNFSIVFNGMGSASAGNVAFGEMGIVGNDNTGYLLTADESEAQTFFWVWGMHGSTTVKKATWLAQNGWQETDIQGTLSATSIHTNAASALQKTGVYANYGDGTRGAYFDYSGGTGIVKFNKAGFSVKDKHVNAWLYIPDASITGDSATVSIELYSLGQMIHDFNGATSTGSVATIPVSDLKQGWNLVTIDFESTAKVGNVYGATSKGSFNSSAVHNIRVKRSGTWASTSQPLGIGAVYISEDASRNTIATVSGNLNKTFNASNSTYMTVDITLPDDSALSAEDSITVSLGVQNKGNDGANDMRWNVPVSQLTVGATTTVKLSLLSPEEVYPMRGYTTADLNNGTVIPYDVSWLAAIDSIAVSVTRIGVIAANDALVTIGNIAFLDDYIETTIDASSKSKSKNPAINSIATVDSANAQFGSAYVESSAKNEVAFFAKDYNHTFDRAAGETQYMPTIMSLKEGDVISFWVKAASETKDFNLFMEFASGAIGTDIGSRNDSSLSVGSGSSLIDGSWHNWDGLMHSDGTYNAARYETGEVTVTTEWKEFRFTVGTTGTTSLGGSIDWRNVNFMRFFNNGTAVNYMVDGLRIIKADSIQADTSKVFKLRQGADVNTYDASRNMVITATREDGTTYVAANNAANVKYDLSQVNTAELGTYPVIVSYNNGLADLTTKVYVEVVADKQYLIEAIPGETMNFGTYDATKEGTYGDGTGGHPSAADHQKIAEILIDSISNKMMWN